MTFHVGNQVRWQQGQRWFDGQLTRRHPHEWPGSDWAVRITGLGTLYDESDDLTLLGAEVDAKEQDLTLLREPVTVFTAACLAVFVLLCGALTAAGFLTGSPALAWALVLVTGIAAAHATGEIRYMIRYKIKERRATR